MVLELLPLDFEVEVGQENPAAFHFLLVVGQVLFVKPLVAYHLAPDKLLVVSSALGPPPVASPVFRESAF